MTITGVMHIDLHIPLREDESSYNLAKIKLKIALKVSRKLGSTKMVRLNQN